MSAQASSRLGTAMLGAASGAAATLAVHRSQQAHSPTPSPPQSGQGGAALPQLQPTVVHVETSSGTRGGTTALVGGAVLVGGV